MADHLVYDFGVDSLFRGLGADFTPALRERVREAGIDPDRPLMPAYKKEVWVRVVDVIARELSAGGDLAAARRDLGYRIANGFAETTLGVVMAPAVRLIGVRRALQRLPRSFSMSNNFMKTTVHELGPTDLRVEVSEPVPSAEFLAGCIEAVARYAGAKTCAVQPDRSGALTAFHVTWS